MSRLAKAVTDIHILGGYIHNVVGHQRQLGIQTADELHIGARAASVHASLDNSAKNIPRSQKIEMSAKSTSPQEPGNPY